MSNQMLMYMMIGIGVLFAIIVIAYILISKKLNSSEKTIAILVRKNIEISPILKLGRENNILIESDKNTNLYTLDSSVDFYKLTNALCNPYNINILYDFILSNYVSIDFSPANLINKDENEKISEIKKCLDVYFKARMNKTWYDLVKSAQKEPILQILRKIYVSCKPWKKYSQDINKQTYYRINHEVIYEDLSRDNKRKYITLEMINESLNICITKGISAKSRDIIEDSNRIRIICTTIHASKGLEYDTVILPYTAGKIGELKKDSVEISYENNKLGYYFNINKNEYYNEYFDINNENVQIKKEETRILYVAMTRAINKFIWFTKGSKKGRDLTWANLLEGELENE